MNVIKLQETLIELIMKLISENTLFGLPTAVFMAVPFIMGVILGVLIKKTLKIAAIITILVGAGIYLGVISIGFIDTVRDLLEQYGPQAIHLATMIIGMLPLGLGLAVGLIVGLKYG